MSKWLFAHYRSPESTLPIGVIVDNQKDLVIAEVYELEGVNNGPLMASAPELLDALLWAARTLEFLRKVDMQSRNDAAKLREFAEIRHEAMRVLPQVQSAIAKAEATNGR